MRKSVTAPPLAVDFNAGVPGFGWTLGLAGPLIETEAVTGSSCNSLIIKGKCGK